MSADGGSAGLWEAALSSVSIVSWLAVLACALLAAFSFAKGFVYAINPDIHLYNGIYYRDGVVHRGLVGDLLSSIVDQAVLADTLAVR